MEGQWEAGPRRRGGRIWVGEVSLQSLEAEAGPHCSETPCLGSSERSRQGPGALGTVRHANQEGARFPFPGRKASSLSSSPPPAEFSPHLPRPRRGNRPAPTEIPFLYTPGPGWAVSSPWKRGSGRSVGRRSPRASGVSPGGFVSWLSLLAGTAVCPCCSGDRGQRMPYSVLAGCSVRTQSWAGTLGGP